MNKNIGNQNQIDTVNIYQIKDSDSERNSTIKSSEKKNKEKINKCNDKCNKNTIIIFIVLIVVLIMVFLGIFGPWDKINIINTDKKNEYQMTYAQYKDELRFDTKVDDLKRITIIQKFDENMTLDGLEIQNKLFTITTCDIYIISKEESNEIDNNLYNETYNASISISSQCLSDKEDNCEPNQLVDFLNIDNNNLRNLEQISDLKDIPVSLCLFTITDTNIITSISCPESLPENIKNEIISYLNYFRPIATSSSNKKDEFNMTQANGIKHMIRNSRGLCNSDNTVYSNSFCNIDMNITKDTDGNLLSNEETIFINITSDIKNKLIQKVITKLIDETSKIKSLNPDKYKNILNDFLSKLNPYLKYEEKFSVKTSNKNKKKVKIDRVDLNPIRKLENENNTNNSNDHLVKEENIFFKEIYSAEISLKLKIDSDINSEAMRTSLNLKLGNKNSELVDKYYLSNLSRIIKKIKSLAQTGNYLASQFYEKINEDFDNLTEEITIRIRNLNSLIIYKDLTSIFDSTLSLGSINIFPYDILEDSKNLFNKINFVFNEIRSENGDFKNYSKILKDKINDYLEESNNMIAKVFNNMDKLKDLLQSPKNIFTEISTYYSNNTPTSYVSTIKKAEDVYLNDNLKKDQDVNKTIMAILNKFERKYYEIISKQYNLPSYLYSRLKNKSITVESTTNEENEMIMNNLYNSNNYTNLIVDEIKNEIKKIIREKIEEYTISDNEKNKYRNISEETLETGSKLDNDEIFDKLSDQILIKFKENFTNILLYLNRMKEEKFPLIDEVLKEGLFSESAERNIKNNISECGINIINKIGNEQNNYIGSIKEYLDQWLSENLEELNSLKYDLEILLSEESLSEIAYWYDVAFYKSTKTISSDIQYIDALAQKYYSAYNLTLEVALSKVEGSNQLTLLSYERKINKTYFEHYTIFKNNLENLKNYINNNLYDDLFYEYKNIFFKIKEILQTIKNNKLTDIYPDINHFIFNNLHINCIDDLNNQINKYLSLEIFNDDYSSLLNDFKTSKIDEIDNIIKFIDGQHSVLSKLRNIEEVAGEDSFYVCIDMKFNKKYSEVSYCRNSFYEQYIKITDYSIYTDDVIKNIGNFNNITSNITQKANSYNDIINLIKNNIPSIEKETLNKNLASDYLSPIKNQIDLILSQQYGEKLIKASYNYYKNNLYRKIDNILNVINNSFAEIFNSLEEQLNDNLPNLKYSMNRFSLLAQVYQNIISSNLTYYYINSIEELQKNEFNYTISYYYNYLLRLVNSTYNYVINNIPINDMNLNNIYDLRKNEVGDIFNELIKKIIDSKNADLNISNQINVLSNEESNFFDIAPILNEHIRKTDDYLDNKEKEILHLPKKDIYDDEYSFALNFYFENSDFSKQIGALNNQIYDKLYIELNPDKFKELMNKNFDFDVNEIIKQIRTLLFDSNKEIYNDFLVVKKNYTIKLEKEINKYFTKEGIIEKINNLYKSEIKLINKATFASLNNFISLSLNNVKKYLNSESQRLNTTSVSYNKDISTINNTLKQYKDNFFNEIISIIYNIGNDFRNNLINKVYNKYIESGLDLYIIEAKKYTDSFKEYKLLNSTYNLGEIINDIIKNLTYEYKEIVKRQIDYGLQLRLTRVKTNINTDSLKTFINDEIEKVYNSSLLIVLQKVAKYEPGIYGYPAYDFDSNIKSDIDNNFTTNINNIKNLLSSGIKGDNYEVNIDDWEPLNFSEINLLYYKNHFEEFISSEENHENAYISESIQKIIKLNFNKSLNNVILSFGNDFFEREEKYNEYFRIIDLYNDLKYTILQTCMSYSSSFIQLFEKNISLPKELKTKIYDMNNIESLIFENMDYIMKSIDTNKEEFIKDVKDSLINNYLSYLENEVKITINFDESVVKIIKNNLNKVKNDIEASYLDSLNSNLNKNFISTYNKTLNIETEDILKMINNSKEDLISEMGNSFTLEPENILEEINDNINKTLNSINEYNSLSFSPPDELIDFFNNFTEDKIKPIYDEFKSNIDKLSNTQIITHFEQNKKDYETSFNLDKIMNYSHESFFAFKDNYIDNISQYLNHYEVDYPEIFEREIIKEKENVINYKPLDDSYQKLLTNFENMKIYIETLKEFNDYDKIIKDNINNLNLAFKESKRIIKDSNFEEDIYNDFNNQLINLKETTLNYYNKVIENYYNIRQYLNESIGEIEVILNKCINTIYKELKEHYQKIVAEEDPIDEEDTKVEEELNTIDNIFKIENTRYYFNAQIKNLLHYTRFKFNLEFENNDYRKLKIFTSVINKSRPKKKEIDIYSSIGHCGRKGFLINTNINDVIYQMNLNYDTKSNNIAYTTFANFDKYEYNIEQYQLEDTDETICFTIDYITFCFVTGNCHNRTSLFNEKYFNEQKMITENY